MASQKKDKKRKNSKFTDKELILLCLNGICVLQSLAIIIRYIWVIIRMDRIIISNNPIYLIIACLLPLAVWLYNTTNEWWNYRNRKIFLLRLYIVNALLTIGQPLYSLLWKLTVPTIIKIPINEAMTENMILNLCRFSVFGPTLFIIGFIIFSLYKVIGSKEGKEKIYSFKLSSEVDMRDNKEHLYDLKNVVKDMHSGKPIVLQEEDLKTGILLNGASGTGKTSSSIIPMARDVLDQKLKNQNDRYKKLEEMLKKESAYIKEYQKDFNEKLIIPKEGHEDEYKKIINECKNCGLTIMAPNNSFMKDILKLAKARGMKVNVIDPDDNWVEQFPDTVIKKKINPFYVPFDLEEKERVVTIINKALVFSEVLVALNEQNKGGETYFRDINTAVTSNIATLIMLANNINHKQTSILEIQVCLDDFTMLEPYINTIENNYKFSISTKVTSKAGQTQDSKLAEDAIKNAIEGNAPLESFNIIGKDADKVRQMEEAIKMSKENPFYHTVVFVKSELLSKDAGAKMYDQARGLRNLLSNRLLADIRFTEILNAETEEERLDFDEILENGEITLVNTCTAFGQGLSTAFGLFFQLNLAVSIKRRPKDLRIPHFLVIDEVSQYVHNFYNDVVSFYRQYGIISCLSIQSLEQLGANEATRFLVTLFQSIGTHIVYGRATTAEMKLYSDMSGIENIEEVQSTTSRNSLFAANSNIGLSERTTQKTKASVEGSDVHYRNFQEIYLFYTRNGDVMRPKLGKVSFLSNKDFHDKKRSDVVWTYYMPEKEAPIEFKEEDMKIVLEQPVELNEVEIQKVTEIKNEESLKIEEERIKMLEELDLGSIFFSSSEENGEIK